MVSEGHTTGPVKQSIGRNVVGSGNVVELGESPLSSRNVFTGRNGAGRARVILHLGRTVRRRNGAGSSEGGSSK
jgi:hypothetical protein